MSTVRETLPGARGERGGWGWLVVTGVLLAGAGVLFAGLFTAFGSQNPDELGWDFRVAYYPAGEAVADLRSPYPPDPHDPALDVPRVYAYPPQIAFLVAPLTALPVDAAVVLAVLGSMAALMGALALVGVRDLRCYAAVVIWAPGWNALEMANVSALLALLLALVWRFRDRMWAMGVALGTMVSLKLFLWPLFVWALLTRRVAGTLWAVAVGLLLTAGSWAAIGFAGLESYRALLGVLAEQQSFSVKGMAEAVGVGSVGGYVLTLGIAAALLALCVRYVRGEDEERAFLTAVVAALAVSPIVWLHYLVLLAVPLGILRPRFTGLWLLPVVLWFSPRSGNGVGIEPFVPALVVAAMVLVLLLPRRPWFGSPPAHSAEVTT